MKLFFFSLFFSFICISANSQTPKEIKELFYNLPLDSPADELMKTIRNDSNFIKITIRDSTANYLAYIKNPYVANPSPDSSKIEINLAMHSTYEAGKYSEFTNSIILTTTYFYSSKKSAMAAYKRTLKDFAFLDKEPGKVKNWGWEHIIEQGKSFQLDKNKSTPYLDVYYCSYKVKGVYSLMIKYEYLQNQQTRKEKQDYIYHPDKIVTYKKVDSVDLNLEIFFPPNDSIKEPRSAIVFFYGGGWINGSTSQFAPHAEYYAKKGYVTFLVNYRVASRNKTSPFESLMDAKSAIRYIKKNANEFKIDSSKIIACGGSAGGQLAAATALVSGYNDNHDDTAISSKPEALVLFNPVIDNGPNGYGYDRIGNQYKNFSPLYNIQKNAPPTIILIGTNDELIPLATIEAYKSKMDSVGSICIVKTYAGQKHGFFNYWFPEYYNKTISEMDRFIEMLRKN